MNRDTHASVALSSFGSVFSSSMLFRLRVLAGKKTRFTLRVSFLISMVVGAQLFLRERHVQGIEHALYINLSERTDRKHDIEKTLWRANIIAKRINAVSVPQGDPRLTHCWDPTNTFKCAGQLGCQLSHIKALEYAAALRWSSVAIFEDDFQWVDGFEPRYVHNNVATIQRLNPDWDVIVLSLNVQEKHVYEDVELPFGPDRMCRLTRVTQALTTHGYLIRARLFQRVIDIFKACKVESDVLIAIDTCWQHLQKETRWYGISPQMATQAESFSDIEGINVFYGIS